MTTLHEIARETVLNLNGETWPNGGIWDQRIVEAACLSAVEQAMQELKDLKTNDLSPGDWNEGLWFMEIDALLARWRQEQGSRHAHSSPRATSRAICSI